MLEIKKQAEAEDVVKILIAGVGGAGSNIIRQLKEAENPMLEICNVAIDTERKALENMGICKTVLIGETLTDGFGTAANLDVGKMAAEKNRDEITELLKNVDILFLVCGMGGGTGAGATSVIAQIAKSMGVLTVAMVTQPYASEDKKHIDNAVTGIELLKESADTVFVFSTDKLLTNLEPKDSVEDVFFEVNEVMIRAIKGIAAIISIPGMINVDYLDVVKVMKDKGKAYIETGIGSADGGCLSAAKQAACSPFMENTIQGADDILVHVSGCVGLPEAGEAVDYIAEVAANKDAQIVLGVEDEMEDSDGVSVMIIATHKL